MNPSIQQKAADLIHTIRTTPTLQAPAHILFGRGCMNRLDELASARKVLIITGAHSSTESGRLIQIETLLKKAGTMQVSVYRGVTGEPTPPMVTEAVQRSQNETPDLILSLGGGSVIDCAKAVAALSTNEGAIEEYLEGVGHRKHLLHLPLPHIAIPTVAGTGAEMTKNAVIGLHDLGVKRSMRFDSMIPTAALIDPDLTVTVSQKVTAHGGMDAITQLIEPCISAKRKPETTALAHEGLRWARGALPACYADPNHVDARAAMSLASMLSGVCLANSGLAMVHGIAAAMGALFDLPHGLLCGLLLPHALRYNREAAAEPLAQALAAFLHRDPSDTTVLDEGIQTIESMNRQFQIPPDLKFLSLSSQDLERISSNASGSSMSGNPVPMTPDLTLKFLQGIS
jgi:alcohol dehydrogenase class IV